LLAADASAQLHPEVRGDLEVPVVAPPSPPVTLTVPPPLA
jgi:hypothetical protein